MQISDRAKGIGPSATLAITARAKQMKQDGVDVISFGAGEPDFPTPEPIRQAAYKAMEMGETRYTPGAGTPRLREAIAQYTEAQIGRPTGPHEVLVANGAKHALYNTFQVLLNPGDEVILPSPYWVSYEEQIRMAGGEVRLVSTKETGFILTPQALRQAAGPRTRVLVINTPSNPTGVVYTKEALQALVEEALSLGLTIISDEIYDRLVYDGEHYSPFRLGPEVREKTILINGVSKTYAMTGWRIGWVVAPSHFIRAMANLQDHATSNPSSISQAGALAAITMDQASVGEMVAAFRQRREVMVGGLQRIPGLTCPMPAGAFYAFPDCRGAMRPGETSDQLAAEILRDVHVAVVPGSAFGAEGYLRLSYATSMEKIQEGMERLERFFAQRK